MIIFLFISLVAAGQEFQYNGHNFQNDRMCDNCHGGEREKNKGFARNGYQNVQFVSGQVQEQIVPGQVEERIIPGRVEERVEERIIPRRVEERLEERIIPRRVEEQIIPSRVVQERVINIINRPPVVINRPVERRMLPGHVEERFLRPRVVETIAPPRVIIKTERVTPCREQIRPFEQRFPAEEREEREECEERFVPNQRRVVIVNPRFVPQQRFIPIVRPVKINIVEKHEPKYSIDTRVAAPTYILPKHGPVVSSRGGFPSKHMGAHEIPGIEQPIQLPQPIPGPGVVEIRNAPVVIPEENRRHQFRFHRHGNHMDHHFDRDCDRMHHHHRPIPTPYMRGNVYGEPEYSV